MPPLTETLAPARLDDVLELDELWSFVARRKDKRWVWLALCRRTRQVVAYAVGDRGHMTCRLLWERVPPALRHALTFTDFWEAYQKVVPAAQHVACGKGSGQTNHITPLKPRAVQQHVAPTPDPVRPQDALVQQVGRDARGLPTAVPAPLQYEYGARSASQATTLNRPLPE